MLELIASVYEAALEPSTWPHLLARVSDALGQASIALTTAVSFEQPVDVWLARYHPACIDLRFRLYERPDANPIVRTAMEIPPLMIVPRQQFLADPEFRHDPAARSLLIAQGLYHGCISTLYRGGPLLSIFEVYRAHRLGRFSASERKLVRRLVPHLANALRVNRDVSASHAHQQQAEEALNRLNVGLLLLANDARIIFANRAAEDLLRRGEGLRRRNDRLVVCGHSDTARLAGVLARTAGLPARSRIVQAMPASRGAGRRPLQVWTASLPDQPSSPLLRASRSDLMMVIIDPERSTAPPIDALKTLYAMTAAEARLTCGLLEGERLEEYAERAGISMNTARTHLKAIFAKTETTRQAELVRLLNILRPD